MEVDERNLSRQARRKLAMSARRTAKKRAKKKKNVLKRQEQVVKIFKSRLKENTEFLH